MQKVGLALGSGGAKGLAHIPVLEVLDEFGIRPHCITGSSMGAVIGVLYASGLSGSQMREWALQRSFRDSDTLRQMWEQRHGFKWFNYLNINWGGSTLLKADTFIDDLMSWVKCAEFGDLEIPLKVVAADFWEREQVVFSEGPLRTAIHASMALPGIFSPVVIDRQVLVDGGSVNPVPYDLLDDCDVTIAVNVIGGRTESEELVPTMAEAVFNTFQIMQTSILKQNLKRNPPDIYLSPDIVDIQMLEFFKASQIFSQTEKMCNKLRDELRLRGFSPVS